MTDGSQITLRFAGAQVLTPAGWTDRPVGIAGGRIEDADGPTVRLDGFRLLPGIVDLHGDGFERHVAPRRGALEDIGRGIRATESELAANGITTAYLAQFWSWEGGMRGPEFAERVFAAIDRIGPEVATDLRPQLRLETHMLDDFDRIADVLGRWRIGYLVFNDHLQHARLARGQRPRQMTGQALKSGRNPEAHLALMQALHARAPDVPAALDALTGQLAAAGVLMGAHDEALPDDCAAWARRGVALAEFPETRAAAQTARDAGRGVVMGAPNVMRGASHKGNVSALALIEAGLVDALASDYHYPSLLAAAEKLVSIGLCDWAGAWRLLSEGPARLAGLTDRGRIAPGARADLVVLDAGHRVAGTIADGRFSHLGGDLAARVLAA